MAWSLPNYQSKSWFLTLSKITPSIVSRNSSGDKKGNSGSFKFFLKIFGIMNFSKGEDIMSNYRRTSKPKTEHIKKGFTVFQKTIATIGSILGLITASITIMNAMNNNNNNNSKKETTTTQTTVIKEIQKESPQENTTPNKDNTSTKENTQEETTTQSSSSEESKKEETSSKQEQPTVPSSSTQTTDTKTSTTNGAS